MKQYKAFLLVLALSAVCISSCSKVAPPFEYHGNVPSLKITGDYAGCSVGVFLNDGDPASSEIDCFEQLISKEVAVVMWFKDFTCEFPATSCEVAYKHKSVPMICWEPRQWGESSPTFPLSGIAAGSFDPYIATFAHAAKSWGKPLFIRFAHEMNGNWYPWDGTHNGNSSADYIAAWRRIHATFESIGAKNVTWVWCPNNSDIPASAWNTAESYYPGDECVDWIGINGYSFSDMSTEDFDYIFQGMYSNLTSLHSNKPFMIGEFSVSTQDAHQDKSTWITSAFDEMRTSYTKFKLFMWFDLTKHEGVWKYYKLCSTETAAVAAFRNSMADPHYISTIN